MPRKCPLKLTTYLWDFSFCKVKRGSYRVGNGTRKAGRQLSTAYREEELPYNIQARYVVVL